MSKKLFVASDHAGLSLKSYLLKNQLNYNWVDLGPQSDESVDYPDFADILAKKIREPEDRGVLICGSGQGMCMRANKFMNIRAALCFNEETAKLAREHNDANVLCLGGRIISKELAQKIIDIFMTTKFEGGRHEKRVAKISKPTKLN